MQCTLTRFSLPMSIENNLYFFQQCDSNYKHQWTNNNNLQCSDNNVKTKSDRCSNGACVGTPYNCLSCERHDGSGCSIQSGYCIVQHGGQRTCFAKYQYKPGNPCQVMIVTVVFDSHREL